jgi:two-component system nitrate/nitrite response regulator NarL
LCAVECPSLPWTESRSSVGVMPTQAQPSHLDSDPGRVRVMIISETRLHRDGLAILLGGCPSITVVGVHDLQDSISALRGMTTDVALLDAPLTNNAGIVSTLRSVVARLRILAVGVRETASDVLACAAAGIDGYVRIEASLRDAVSAIENVVRGELVCSPKVVASLYQSIRIDRGAPLNAALTARELQVAELMNRGLSNKEIARRLHLQPSTAKNHVRNILGKLNVHRRGQAVAKLRSLIGEQFVAAE